MKTRLISLFIALLASYSLTTVAQDIEWVQHAGEAGENVVHSVATDAEGNCFVAGSFYESIKFGNKELRNNGESPSAFVAKFDQSGNLLWANNGVGKYSKSYAVAVDENGNSYVAGCIFDLITFSNQTVGIHVNSDIFVAKYNSNGVLQWVTSNLASYYLGTDLDIKVDAQGNSYITGGIVTGNSYYDAAHVSGYVIKLNTDGQKVFSTGLGNAIAYNMAHDPVNENLYIVGNAVKSAVVGGHKLTSAGMTDIFVAKLKATTGEVESVLQIGGSNEELGKGIAVDKQGNCYFTGLINGNLTIQNTTLKAKGKSDILLAKLSPEGAVLWVQNAGSSTDDNVADLALDSSGNPYITGVYTGTATFGTKEFTATSAYGNIYLAQFSPAGVFNAFHTLGGTGRQESQHITFDKVNNLLFAGTIAGNVQFGQFAVNAKSNELFVAKIKAESLVKQPDPSEPVVTPEPSEPIVTAKGKLPNIITPNGDGKNDVFNTSILTGDQPQKRFTVYNKYGVQVYHNNNYQDNWSASGLSDGAYFYTLTCIVEEALTTYKGWVEVIR